MCTSTGNLFAKEVDLLQRKQVDSLWASKLLVLIWRSLAGNATQARSNPPGIKPRNESMPDIVEHQVATQVEELRLPSVLMNAIAVSTVGRYEAGVRVHDDCKLYCPLPHMCLR
jgi:hypothetical protein